MLANTKVLMTLIITGGLVVLGLVGTLAFLAAKSADATTILSLVSTLLGAFTLARTYALSGQQSTLKATVDQVKDQTNGTNARLIDHAIGTGPARE